jgi:hypothetical protein
MILWFEVAVRKLEKLRLKREIRYFKRMLGLNEAILRELEKEEIHNRTQKGGKK